MKKLLGILILGLSFNSIASDFTISVQANDTSVKAYLYRSDNNQKLGRYINMGSQSVMVLSNGYTESINPVSTRYTTTDCSGTPYFWGSTALAGVVMQYSPSSYGISNSTMTSNSFSSFRTGAGSCTTVNYNGIGLSVSPISDTSGLVDVLSLGTNFYYKIE